MHLDVLEGSPDEAGLVVADADLDVLRQLGLNPLQLVLDPIDDLDGVGARLLADLDADRRRAAEAGGAADFLDAVLDHADVGEGDDRSVGAVGDDDAVEVVDVLDAAHCPHRDVGRPGGELAAGNLDVLPLYGGAHLFDGEAVGVQAIGVEHQLDLALALAVVADRADVLDGFELLLDPLFGNFGQLFRRARPVDGEAEDRLRVRIHLGDLQRPGVARELVDDLRQFVADVLGRRFDVALEREVDRDARVALIGGGAQLVDAADRIDGFLDPLGDLRFDLLGAGAGKVGLHRDDRDVGLGHQIEAERLVRHGAEDDERRRHHDREDRTVDADFCDFQ